jgi:hypothetical protein
VLIFLRLEFTVKRRLTGCRKLEFFECEMLGYAAGGIAMSFNNLGAQVFLEPGQSAYWNYSWSNGQDMGLQLAGPNTFAAPGLLGTLVTSNQGKIINGINNVAYVVTITNISTTEGASHNLQGGGVS